MDSIALAGQPQSVAAPTRAAAARQSPWLVGPAWDAVWMLNALWLLPLVLWLARGADDPAQGPLDALYFVLTATFWIGHRLASSWLAWCTEAYRPLVRAQPVRFVVLPLLVTAICFAILLPSDSALPWTRAERVIGLAIVDYALNTYHFGAQHFGALSLYRSRARSNTRTMDRLFALGVGGALVFLADILAGSVAYPDLWVNGWLPMAWIASSAAPLRDGAMLVLAAATAAMLFVEARAPRVSLPRILYVFGLAAMVAVALQPRSLFPFLVVWTAQHWILATGLASRTASAAPQPPRGRLRRALHALNTRPWAMLILLAIVSLLLLPVFEVEAVGDSETHYGDRIFGAFAMALRESVWVPALVALGFASGFLHYLMDRNVYRMSDARVREAARGLLAPSRLQQ